MDITSLANFWKVEDTHKKKENQKGRYERLNASPEILRIINIGGGPGMGTVMEKIARFHFNPLLKDRDGSGHDHRYIADITIRLEQKSSGLWDAGENSFKWQHLEIDHNWDGLLLVGIQAKQIDFWGMTRAAFVTAVKSGKVTNQGNKEKNSSEGMWMNYQDIKDSLMKINTNEELVTFVNACVITPSVKINPSKIKIVGKGA